MENNTLNNNYDLKFVKVGFGLFAIDKVSKVIYDMGSTNFKISRKNKDVDTLLKMVGSYLENGGYSLVITHPHFDHFNLLLYAIKYKDEHVLPKISKIYCHNYSSDKFKKIVNYFQTKGIKVKIIRNKIQKFKIESNITGFSTHVIDWEDYLNKVSINCAKEKKYFITGDQCYETIESNIAKITSSKPINFNQFQIPHHGGSAGKCSQYYTLWTTDQPYITWDVNRHGVNETKCTKPIGKFKFKLVDKCNCIKKSTECCIVV